MLWIALLPKTTEGRRLHMRALIGGAVLGAIVGFSVQGPIGVLLGAFLGAGGGSMLFAKSLRNNQGQQEWANKPVLVPLEGQAFLTRAPDGMLVFNWFFATPTKEKFGDSLPLSSVEAFQAGSMNEWFSGAEDRRKYGDCLAIVLHSPDEGTKLVVMHGGSRADIQMIHSALTKAFISGRRGLQTTRAQPAQVTGRPTVSVSFAPPKPSTRPVTETPPRYSDERPTDL